MKKMKKIILEAIDSISEPKSINPDLSFIDDNIRDLFQDISVFAVELNFEDIPSNEEIPTQYRDHYFNYIEIKDGNLVGRFILTWVDENSYHGWILWNESWTDLGTLSKNNIFRKTTRMLRLISR